MGKCMFIKRKHLIRDYKHIKSQILSAVDDLSFVQGRSGQASLYQKET